MEPQPEGERCGEVFGIGGREFVGVSLAAFAR
jgi:hypothetical protein